MSFITSRKAAEGLGSARHGTPQYWEQQISAIALVFLVPMFVFPFAYNVGDGYEAVHAAYSHPVNAIIAIAFLATAWLHWFQGIQIMLEDYVPGRLKIVLVIALRLLSALFVLTGIFSILKVALGA